MVVSKGVTEEGGGEEEGGQQQQAGTAHRAKARVNARPSVDSSTRSRLSSPDRCSVLPTIFTRLLMEPREFEHVGACSSCTHCLSTWYLYWYSPGGRCITVEKVPSLFQSPNAAKRATRESVCACMYFKLLPSALPYRHTHTCVCFPTHGCRSRGMGSCQSLNVPLTATSLPAPFHTKVVGTACSFLAPETSHTHTHKET